MDFTRSCQAYAQNQRIVRHIFLPVITKKFKSAHGLRHCQGEHASVGEIPNKGYSDTDHDFAKLSCLFHTLMSLRRLRKRKHKIEGRFKLLILKKLSHCREFARTPHR